PFETWSTVSTCPANGVGCRGTSRATKVPRRKVLVARASAESIDHGSRYERLDIVHVSGIQPWWKPSRSAHCHSRSIASESGMGKLRMSKRSPLGTETEATSLTYS